METTLQDFPIAKGTIKGTGRSLFSLGNGQIVRYKYVRKITKELWGEEMKKKILIATLLISLIILTGCDGTTESNTTKDVKNTLSIGDELASNQPTPTDINYSLERFNLIKRTYWVNGQREKAMQVESAILRPLGYIVLFTDNGGVVGQFTVDGKVTSLNSYLTPDSMYYELAYGGSGIVMNSWLPDVDGSYGENDNGIFFFTVDGKYIEWTGTYLYSDIMFEIDDPIVRYSNEK